MTVFTAAAAPTLNGRTRVACHRDILIFQDAEGFWIGAYDSFDFGVQPDLETCISLIEEKF